MSDTGAGNAGAAEDSADGGGTGRPNEDRADQMNDAPVDADKAAAETHGFEHDDPTDAAAAQN